MAKHLADNGYDVVGYDYKGFGLSEGKRAFILNEQTFIDDGFNFVIKTKEYYKDSLKISKIKIVSYGYSLGGALAMGIERLYGKETPVFDAHVFMSPNIGVSGPLRMTEEKTNEVRELIKTQPDKDLFQFNPNPPEYLSDYYKDPL